MVPLHHDRGVPLTAIGAWLVRAEFAKPLEATLPRRLLLGDPARTNAQVVVVVVQLATWPAVALVPVRQCLVLMKLVEWLGFAASRAPLHGA